MTNTYVVTLPADPPLRDIETGQSIPETVEHTGHVEIEAGALVFRALAFEQPTIGYAPGQWLRFEKKEA